MVSERQRCEAVELLNKGVGFRSVSQRLGISEYSAQKIRDGLRQQTGQIQNLDKFNVSAMRVIDDGVHELYEKAVKAAAAASIAKPRGQVDWTPPIEGPIGIAAMADVHLGHQGVDYASFERDKATILNTEGMYLLLGGDLIDNHIKHLSAIIAQRMTPKQQWGWLAELLQELVPKLIAVVGGNHEAWTVAATGFDPLEFILGLLACPYDADEVAVHAKLAGVEYLLSVRHKYRFKSVYNAGHTVKQLWTFGDEDFDVGIVGHDHDATAEPFYRHRLKRLALRPGTYQVISKFARQVGFHGAQPITPVAVLWPGERRLTGFDNVDDAALFLKAARAEWVKGKRKAKA